MHWGDQHVHRDRSFELAEGTSGVQAVDYRIAVVLRCCGIIFQGRKIGVVIGGGWPEYVWVCLWALMSSCLRLR